MTTAQRNPPAMEGKTQIPGYEKYWIDQYGDVFTFILNGIGFHVHRMKRYTDPILKREYFVFPHTGGLFNTSKSNRKYVKDLMKLVFGEQPIAIRPTVIKFNSGEGRKPLNRTRVINHLIHFCPEVQIPLTPNKDGVYETSEGMKSMGITICENCGHPNAVENNRCLECNEWILTSQ